MRQIKHVSALLLLILATLTQAETDTSVTHRLFQVSSQVLANGLHVIRHHRDISDTFTVQLVVDVGFQDFNCNEQQLPHLLEHLMFEGTSRFDRQALRQRIRDHGGKSNAFTTEEYTHYTIDIHSDYPNIALENLQSMLTESLFAPEHLASSRQVIHAELGTSSNSLQLAVAGKKDLAKMAKARIFSGSNLKCPDLTTPDNIPMARIKSVFAEYYVPTNMTLIIIGHFDDAKIDALLQSTLVQLPAAASPQRQPVTFTAIDYSPVVAQKTLFDPEVDVDLYIPALGTTHPDYPAFQIAAEYLGEKLFYDVRGQKGLGYTPYAYVDSNSEYGFLRATTRTSDRWYEEVSRLFIEQYQKMRTDGIPVADVERIKHKLILEFESKQRNNSELAQIYRHHRHFVRAKGAMPDLIDNIKQMDTQQVNAVMQRYFPPQPLLASARPPSLIEASIRILPVALILGGLGVYLLRWSHRRRSKKFAQ